MVHTRLLIGAFVAGTLFTTPAQAYTVHTVKKYGSSWGTQTSINLYNCSPGLVRSQGEIERFIRSIFNYLGLVRHGNTQFLYHYAGNGYTSGFSAFQHGNGHTDLTIRVDESTNDMYIDLFSCVPHGSYEIAQRARDFFGAYQMSYDVTNR